MYGLKLATLVSLEILVLRSKVSDNLVLAKIWDKGDPEF